MRPLLVVLSLALTAPLLAEPISIPSWRQVAEQYRHWNRIGDERPMLGPLDCPFYPPRTSPVEAQPRRSQAQRGEHSRKAFFLYVSNEADYTAVVRRNVPPTEGLTIVKETFRPEDLGPYRDQQPEMRSMPEVVPNDPSRRYRPRREGRRLLGVGEPVGLFVMRYQGRRWRFATVHFDGRVESSGAMPQCARCHDSAPHHGVFGAGL